MEMQVLPLMSEDTSVPVSNFKMFNTRIFFPTGVRSCYDEGKRVAETLMFDYHRQHGIGKISFWTMTLDLHFVSFEWT